MKVELSSAELQVLMAPSERAHAEVIRLSTEVSKLRDQVVTLTPMVGNPTDTDKVQILNALANVCAQVAAGNKINAIKITRELTGIGLKEAKDVVEGNYSGPGVRKAQW